MKCQKCGNEVELFRKFCTNCGCKQNWINYWIAIIITVIVIIATLVIIGLFCIYKSSLETTQTIQLKKTFSTINQALLMSEAIEGKRYRTTDDIIEHAIISRLNVKERSDNEIILVDDTILTFNKLNGNTHYEIIVTPDVKFLGRITFKNDQEHYHIYGNGYNIFVEQGSTESQILNN